MMLTDTRGSARRFLYLRPFWSCPNRSTLPSHSNQTGLTCGSPLGPIVAMFASAVEAKRSSNPAGITVLVVVISYCS